MNDPLEGSARIDDEERLRLVSELVGVRVDPQHLPDVATFLAELRQLADELLVLDLEAAQPDAVYDPRWSESEG